MEKYELSDVPKWALSVMLIGCFFLVSVLGAGNIFFVSRLVDQQQRTAEVVAQLRQDLAVLSALVENFRQEAQTRRKQ